MNKEGKVITNPKEKKTIILEHFKNRLRKRPAKEEVNEIITLGEQLFQKRYKHAKGVKSPEFSMTELEFTLKSLTTGKSRDPEFLKCDIFKENVIGDDLKLSILMMLNKMKEKSYIPASFKVAKVRFFKISKFYVFR